MAALKIVKALKKARNEARSLPLMQRHSIDGPLEKLLARAEESADQPYGKRRSANDKRRAVKSAFRLLCAFGIRPTSTTENSVLYKLAAELAGDETGMDHHCRDFLKRANRV